MIAAAYFGGNNKESPSGYGLRIRRADRDRYFKRDWDSVTIRIESGDEIRINIRKSFWRHCTELMSPALGKWMFDNGLAPWPKGSPPKFKLELIEDGVFFMSRI